MQPGQCFLQSPLFSETVKILKFILLCINNLVTVILRVLKIKNSGEIHIFDGNLFSSSYGSDLKKERSMENIPR